ncbi:hypothetical protein [Rhizobium leguminosarum]|uniref:hypothetical protein n=1 Tax=Rhizobium leguminosarum TaxID=384 RepID=UPI00048016D6|nr:hypothetical protein [Rhizobium leguminosarum]
MALKHPEYAHGLSNEELVKEAIEFCDEELDSFEGMEYDSDSEVCCQRSNTLIRELVLRLAAALSTPPQQEAQGEPVGYVTKNELTKLSLGASCVDLFGKVVPKGFEMVPLYARPHPRKGDEDGK